MTVNIYPAASPEPGALNLMGIQMHSVSVGRILEYIEEVIKKNEYAVMPYMNIHAVNLALRHDWLKSFFNRAPLVWIDSDGLRGALQFMGCSTKPKTTLTRWVWPLAEFCAGRGLSLFLLGARPGIAEEAAGRLKERFPRLKITGTHHGYFSKEGEESRKVVETINQAAPDILIVAFGMPAQEKWIDQYGPRLKTHIFLPAGALFDYVSGRQPMPPAWVVEWHLEWLSRLWEEPVRLFVRYVFGVPYFYFRFFIWRLGRKS